MISDIGTNFLDQPTLCPSRLRQGLQWSIPCILLMSTVAWMTLPSLRDAMKAQAGAQPSEALEVQPVPQIPRVQDPTDTRCPAEAQATGIIRSAAHPIQCVLTALSLLPNTAQLLGLDATQEALHLSGKTTHLTELLRYLQSPPIIDWQLTRQKLKEETPTGSYAFEFEWLYRSDGD